MEFPRQRETYLWVATFVSLYKAGPGWREEMEYMTVTYKLFFSKEHLRDLEKEGRDMQVEPTLTAWAVPGVSRAPRIGFLT